MYETLVIRTVQKSTCHTIEPLYTVIKKVKGYIYLDNFYRLQDIMKVTNNLLQIAFLTKCLCFIFLTDIPAPPVILDVIALSESSILVTWTAGGDPDDVGSFEVQYKMRWGQSD